MVESVPTKNDNVNNNDNTIHKRSSVWASGELSEALHSTTTSQASRNQRRSSVCEIAKQVHLIECRSSKITDLSNQFPTFSPQEVQLGKQLGKGGFGVVFELRDIAIPPQELDHDDNVDEELQLEREFLATHCSREDTGDARYAIKKLKQETLNSPEMLCQGIADLNTETRLLSSLDHHPNIIKLRGFGDRFTEGFFLIIDRLYDTLDQRLCVWKKQKKSLWGRVLGAKQKQKYYEERLFVCYDLSSALAHLHKHGIMHRDLKPDNMGFDIRGDIKVFDFGLAKEIPRNKEDDYQMTQMVGSPRYMAPEVALGQAYNESCDVYSFSLIVWQIMNLKKPYDNFSTLELLEKHVWSGHERPPIQGKWDETLKTTLRKCWSSGVEQRPAMDEIELTFKTLVVPPKEEQGSQVTLGKRFSHLKRRSTHVFAGQAKEKSESFKTMALISEWAMSAELQAALEEEDEEDQ